MACVQMVLQIASETVLLSEDDTSEAEWQAFLRVHAASTKMLRLLQQEHNFAGPNTS